MAVELVQSPNRLTAKLSGEIDHHSARGMRESIDRALTGLTPRELELDFSGVGFMDSSGIGLVMGRYKLIHRYGGRLYLSGLSPQLQRVMKLSGVDRLAVIEQKGQKRG